MKRFIVSVLGITVFCVGLGAIVENVGARFKSDEKALTLIRQARLAIGGDQSLAEVRSMVIKGNTTHTFRMGTETRTEQGETEIAMQLPDKLSKMVRIGRHEGAAGENIVNEKHDILVMRGDAKSGEWTTADDGKKVIVRKIEGGADGHGEFTTSDGKKVILRKIEGGSGGEDVEKIVVHGNDGEFTTSDGKKVIVRHADGADVEQLIAGDGEKGKRIFMDGDARMAHHGAARQNELLRTTLSLLLTAPEGMDVSYTYGGEGDVDGTTCNIVNASFGGSILKLYLSKASSLPVMVSYQGHDLPRMMVFKKAPESGDVSRDVVTFDHKMVAPRAAEFKIRFSDYRGTNGIQLPYRWTTSVNGQTSEVFDVTGYEINPANIAERFQNQKVSVRTKGSN